MSQRTAIEWADSTFNPWMGCTKVSPACDHCYAERDTKRFGRVEWGAGKPRVRTSAANWKLPERWNCKSFIQCANCAWRGDIYDFHKIDPTGFRHTMCPSCNGVDFELARRRVFCASLADWLDNEVPIEWLVELLDLIRRTPNLDWLALSKRIGNWRWRLMSAHGHLVESVVDGELSNWVWEWLKGNPPANVWVGATVVNQAEADRDVPKLLAVPARVRFLSIEPMLGPINLKHMDVERAGHREWCCINALTGEQTDMGRPCPDVPRLHWVIAGGESGPHARPMHPDWVRSLRDQCAAADVPFLFKQHGEWLATDFCSDEDVMLPSKRTVYVNRDGSYVDGTEGFDFFAGFKETAWVGKKPAGRQLDGRTHNGFPVVQP